MDLGVNRRLIMRLHSNSNFGLISYRFTVFEILKFKARKWLFPHLSLV